MRGKTRRAVTPPPARERTKWQLRRDKALLEAGRKKSDVTRTVRQMTKGDDPPSDSAVRAVLDGRYRDERIQRAFLVCIGAEPSDGKEHAKYFPEDEPPYHGRTG